MNFEETDKYEKNSHLESFESATICSNTKAFIFV